MKFSFCPECAALILQAGALRCKCGYQGPMSSGSMDEINAFKKRMGKFPKSEPIHQATPARDARDWAEEKKKSLKGLQNDDFEIL
ncbi:MAG: hypothetical protein NUV67_03905 [archaeon]|nr:hypothetical protein [archaeon]